MKKKLQNKKSADFSKSWLNIWAERGGKIRVSMFCVQACRILSS
jgi:hypothetical protein